MNQGYDPPVMKSWFHGTKALSSQGEVHTFQLFISHFQKLKKGYMHSIMHVATSGVLFCLEENEKNLLSNVALTAT